MDSSKIQPLDCKNAEELEPTDEAGEKLSLRDLSQVKLEITADLGQCSMKVREVLELTEGSIIPLNKLAGEMANISVNNIPLAKGEMMVLGDSLHVRIADVLGVAKIEE